MTTDTRPGPRVTTGRPAAPDDGSRAGLTAAVLLAAGVVALLTLTPAGRGYAFGDPVTELRWYAAGLDSPGTLAQLLGNLLLLAPLAGLAVLRWPALGRGGRLLAAAVTAGATIELLQWTLSLGRVVSPLDALLNATGAVLVGGLVAASRRLRA
ncbi:VanZ family protein [Modestobacter sp. I12A-02628]|uniref:VanZ family protein n=1 Tax=Goekera deserti TaxID=2497753 RepID=UPI00128D22AE|nr:VanZ family protein [Goekera deserti]MPQ99082.1 VanZ family protein [Goekera deserti]